MQLRELAESVGLPLYEQLGKKIHLTAAGQALARRALAMVGEWQAFEQEIGAMQGLTSGQLRISVASTAKYFVPRIIGRFCGLHPRIDVSLQILNRDGVVARLRENLDDLYILSWPPSDLPLVRHAFLDNPLVVVAAASHPLAAGGLLRLSSLRNEAFVMREQGSGTRLAADACFERLRFQPRVRLELGSNEALKQLVATGMGLSVLSRHALARDPRAEGLAVLQVRGFPVQANWFTLYPQGKRLSPIAEEFLRHLGALAEESATLGQ